MKKKILAVVLSLFCLSAIALPAASYNDGIQTLSIFEEYRIR